MIGSSLIRSGDYFEAAGTGVAIVIRTQGNATSPESTTSRGKLMERMKAMFEREWDSEYAHPLEKYMERCMGEGETEGREEALCEGEKDAALLAPSRK